MSTTTKGTALITGASAGIGAIYADRLAQRGYDLILVARDKTRLAGLAQRLRSSTGRSVDAVAADLNDKTDLAKIEAILRGNADITLLVNFDRSGCPPPGRLRTPLRAAAWQLSVQLNRLARRSQAARIGRMRTSRKRGSENQDDRRTAPTKPKEAMMHNSLRSIGQGRSARCAVCDGKFGLVRYYSWRTPLCSTKCVDRFRSRRASDRNWLWLQVDPDRATRTAWRAL